MTFATMTDAPACVNTPGVDDPGKGTDVADVRAIRASYVYRKTSMYGIAEQYGVNQGAIWQVIHRKTWTHVE